jgi:hypothetical protein
VVVIITGWRGLAIEAHSRGACEAAALRRAEGERHPLHI